MLIAIDPGPETSGVAVLSPMSEGPPIVISTMRDATHKQVRDMMWKKYKVGADIVVYEWLTSYGAPMGRSVLETARVCGMIEAWSHFNAHGITRPDIKLELCQSRRAKTKHVSEAIREIYRAGCPHLLGDGKNPVVGTKNKQGPLYGIALSQHEGAALAVGLAWLRNQGATW